MCSLTKNWYKLILLTVLNLCEFDELKKGVKKAETEIISCPVKDLSLRQLQEQRSRGERFLGSLHRFGNYN